MIKEQKVHVFRISFILINEFPPLTIPIKIYKAIKLYIL